MLNQAKNISMALSSSQSTFETNRFRGSLDMIERANGQQQATNTNYIVSAGVFLHNLGNPETDLPHILIRESRKCSWFNVI